MDRLQKVIAHCGICSRRKAEEYILEGRVKVNGVVITTLGVQVSEDDYVEVDGSPIRKERKVYILLNKPRNCVSTVKDDRNRPTVLDIIKDCSSRIYPVGRLDFDTTGALILTNDGKLTNLLTHPSHQVDKVYVATCMGIIEDEMLEPLREGIELDDGKCEPAKAEILKVNLEKKTSVVRIVIHEGKNREVKRMFEKLGFNVLKLNRDSIGGISTRGLYQGQYRKLTKEEVKELYKLVDSKE